MPKLSILIVSFNTVDKTKACLASIYQAPPSGDFEVIVVDNASCDDTIATVKREFPKVKLIENNTNTGFGHANNQAFVASTGEVILLLNSDIEVSPLSDTGVRPLFFEGLLAFADQTPDAGIIAPQLVFPDGSVQPSCFNLPTVWGAIQEYWLGVSHAYSKYYPTGTEPTKVAAVVGAAMLIKRSVIAELKTLFDERYFMYYEDMDLCRRVTSLGKAIYYLPAAQLVHYHGASVAKMGDWAYKQNQKSARIYFGAGQYFLITQILRFGQKLQKIRR